jgi:hypothetical protein
MIIAIALGFLCGFFNPFAELFQNPKPAFQI